MKQLLQTIFLFFIPALSFSQNSFFEISDAPIFDCGSDNIINDNIGFFYSVSSTKSLWGGAGFVYKTDLNGNEIFRKQFNVYDVTYLEDIAFTEDSNLIICGFTYGCDWGPSRMGLIIKMNRQGDTLWTRQINPDTPNDTYDNHLHKILGLEEGSILTSADSIVYKTDSTGNITWQSAMSGMITDIGYGEHPLNCIGTSSGLCLIDTSGNIVTNLPAYANTIYANILSDSTYLLGFSSSLIKTDTAFTTLSQYSLSAINFSASALFISNDSVWITNNTGNDFASFDLNLNLLDTFHTQASQVQANSFSVFDSTIVVAGMEIAQKNYIYLKSFSTSKNYKYVSNDLALIGVSFDTSYAIPYDPFPTISVVSFVPVLTVQNNGLDTINSFYANSISLNNGVCGPFEYHRLVNCNIIPGQIQSFVLDTLREILGISPGFTYHFCAWTACPDFKVDKDHSNDYLCDSFIITEIVQIEMQEEKFLVAIYPNPASPSFTVSRNVETPAMLEIFNTLGEKVYATTLIQNKEIINAKLNPGVYYILISDDEKRITEKLLIE
ncbi:hypothetical protein BH11BAC1_BH11BAC1_16780 [soil metagenome]